jgi:exodeoxyribonuclease VII large subunit
VNTVELHTANEQSPYSPGALMSAFSNSLSSPLLNIPLRVKGIYRQGKGMNYSGLYYDQIKDEFSTASVTAVVPERLRLPMRDGQLIDAHGYLTKRVSPATSRIDLLLTLTEIVSRKEKVVNDEEQRALSF